MTSKRDAEELKNKQAYFRLKLEEKFEMDEYIVIGDGQLLLRCKSHIQAYEFMCRCAADYCYLVKVGDEECFMTQSVLTEANKYDGLPDY